jgi:hypothetical protein
MTDKLNQRNEQVLEYITQIQNQEMALYKSLNETKLTPEEKQMKINKINELTQIRLNLYESIKELLDTYKQNTVDSTNTLKQQVMAINIMEEELNSAKNVLNYVDAQKINKIRQSEINIYYGKRYNTLSKLAKTIIFFSVLLLILAMIYSWNLLPNFIYYFFMGIILIIATIVIINQLIDITSRNNMNWDEYEWINTFPKTDVSISGKITNPWASLGTCVGSQCCSDGTTYNENTFRCVPDNEGFTTLESYSKEPIKIPGLDSDIKPLRAQIKY